MSGTSPSRKASAWSRARDLAERTPETRNRYVDFLRAASITIVVLGHWLIAAPFVEDGRLRLDNMLQIAPWSQWLTWGCQVMPLFFIVGGYSNGVSWESARSAGRSYSLWLATRLKRLVGPVAPLVIVWSVMAMIAHRFGVHPEMIKRGSQVALIPTWFLAVYVMVVVLVPVTRWAWRRFGMMSFWVLALGAAAIDTIAFTAGLDWLRWTNYLFVWLSVHQLGYLWLDGRVKGPARALSMAAAGLAALIFLMVVASYPISMIGVPGQPFSNSRPPTFALLALGVLHGGLVLAVEKPARRWLGRPGPWTTTVLVNGTIMTLYLWHNTAMVLIIGLVNVSGRIGLGLYPGSGIWWAARPIWIAVFATLLSVFLALFGRFEQQARAGSAAPLPVWRTVSGAIAMCFGLTVLALGGIWAEGALGIRLWAVIVVLAGSVFVLGPPLRRNAAT